jgi:hypothetical protein
LIILFSRRSWLVLILCGLIPLWFIYVPGVAGNARFRAPVEGLITLIGGVALSAFARRFKRNEVPE